MPEDVRGLEVTADNAEAVGHLDAVVGAYLRFATDTGQHLKAALAADPEMALAHVVKGCFFQLFCNRALEPRAVKSLEAARASIEARGASARERGHADALAAWIAGDFEGALAAWERVLLAHPRDVLALKLAHYLHFYLGDAAQLRDSVARVRHAWDESVPGCGFVLGMHAFGLEESGDYAAAERAGRRAVELEPEDGWAVHAVAHVMEMQDRRREGVEWLREHEPQWDAGNNFRLHLWWHLALFHVDLEDHDGALALYDERVRAADSDEYLDLCNAASLLWRLEERGVDVGDRWDEVADKAEARVDDRLMVFPDAHYALALAAVGRDAAVERLLAGLRESAGRGDTSEARVAAAAGVPAVEAIAAWYRGDHGAVVDALLPVRYHLAAIGGSHAQRDLFAQLLIAAALADGRIELARALLAERIALKPDNPWGWRRLGRALEALDDDEGARQAAERARRAVARARITPPARRGAR